MKYYFDNDLEITISAPNSIRPSENTECKKYRMQKIPNAKNIIPYTELIYKRKKDIEEKLGVIKELALIIKNRSYYLDQHSSTLIDLTAGLGFVSKVFEKYLNSEILILNDISLDCVEELKNNFDCKIYCLDANKFTNWCYNRLTVIDFNTFNILREEKNIESLLTNCQRFSQNLVISDTYCYSLRFKLKENRKDLLTEYLEKVSELMLKKYNLNLTHYGVYENYKASYLLFQKTIYKTFEEIKYEKIKLTIFKPLFEHKNS